MLMFGTHWYFRVWFCNCRSSPVGGKRAPGCIIHLDTLYRACACYSCRNEDGLSGSKHGHVKYCEKIKIMLSLKPSAFCLLRNKHNQLDTHFTFTFTLLRFKVSTCFWHCLPIIRRHYMKEALVTIVQF
jgi:hypothetical protein